MLSGKTYEQLVQLQDQVRAKLRSGEPLDVEYWEGLLKSLVVWRAKAKLRDMHEVVLSNRLEYLRKRQRDQAIKHQSELAMHLSSGADMLLDPFAGAREAEAEAELAAERDAALAAEEKERETMWEPEMSPEPVDPSRLTYEERRLTVIPEEEDREKLVSARSVPPVVDAARILTCSATSHAALFPPDRSCVDVCPESTHGASAIRRRRRSERVDVQARGVESVGCGRGNVQYGRGACETDVHVGRQVQTAQTEVL